MVIEEGEERKRKEKKLVSGSALSFGLCFAWGGTFEVEGTLGELKAVTE